MIHYISQTPCHKAISLVISKHPGSHSSFPLPPPLCEPSPVYAPMTPLHCHQHLTQQQQKQQQAADTQERSLISALQRSASQCHTEKPSQALHRLKTLSDLYVWGQSTVYFGIYQVISQRHEPLGVHSHLSVLNSGFYRCNVWRK